MRTVINKAESTIPALWLRDSNSCDRYTASSIFCLLLVDLASGLVGAFMYTATARPYFPFLARSDSEIGETTLRSYQEDHKRVPKPREKPACSKTPLHAATKLPACQPLWQPLRAHLQAHASEEATTALLTSFAHRSAVACRAVTTAKPPAGPSHNHDHAGLAPSPALRPRTSPHHAADALAPAIDPPKRR